MTRRPFRLTKRMRKDPFYADRERERRDRRHRMRMACGMARQQTEARHV
jgi:hypothetical protein